MPQLCNFTAMLIQNVFFERNNIFLEFFVPGNGNTYELLLRRTLVLFIMNENIF